jgi:hypothetical protein
VTHARPRPRGTRTGQAPHRRGAHLADEIRVLAICTFLDRETATDAMRGFRDALRA